MANLNIAIQIAAKDAASGPIGQITNALGGLKNSAQQGWSGLQNVATVAGGALVGGVGLATGAIVGLGAASLGAFIPFEEQMNEVFTLLPGISQTAMDQMTGQVEDFSREFGKLPNEVVPALYQAISAGVPPDNVFDFLETSQKAAIGGVTGLETAVDGISSVVNAYGTDVIDAAKASDLMFTAVKLGKTDFDQLSGSLFNVIPTAASLGVEFGDVTAALASMTAQGTPTSVATTQLRQLLVELSKDGTKVSKAFEKMSGKSFKDFIAEGNNLQDALNIISGGFTKTSSNAIEVSENVAKTEQKISKLKQQLQLATVKQSEFNDKTKDSTRLASQNKINDLTTEIARLEGELANTSVTTSTTTTSMADLFGSVEAGNAALALTGKGAEGFANNLAEMADSAGATDAAFDTMDQGIGRSIDRLKAFGATALIQIGDSLSPLAEMVLDFAEGALPTLQDILDNTVVPAIETAVEWVGRVAEKISFLRGIVEESGFTRLFVVFEDGSSYIGSFLEILGLSEPVADRVGAAIANVISEIISLGGIVQESGISRLFVVFEDGSSYIGGFLETLGLSEPVADRVGAVIAIVAGTVFDMVTQFVSWQDVLTAFGAVIASVVLPALYGIVTAAAPVIAVGAALVGAIALARNAWENDWGGIRTAVGNAMVELQPYWERLQVALNQFWQEIIPALQEVWQTLIGVWQTELQPALAELWAAFGDLFEALGFGTGETDFLSVALGALKLGLDLVVLAVEVLSPIIELWSDNVSFAVGYVSQFVEGLASMKRGLDAVIAPLERVADRIGGMIEEALSMPDWLIPGSPTPFELGLRGIGAAINQMPALELGSALTPGPSPIGRGGLALAGVGAAAAGSGGGIVIERIEITANSEAEGRAAGRGFVDELRARGLL